MGFKRSFDNLSQIAIAKLRTNSGKLGGCDAHTGTLHITGDYLFAEVVGTGLIDNRVL